MPILLFRTDYIGLQQHRSDNSLDNLAMACFGSDAYKVPNLSSIEPVTNRLVALFHPRKQSWSDHFQQIEWDIEGLTPVGRATIRLINIERQSPRSITVTCKENGID